MPGVWEIRGLFGNEYAMEEAIEELKEQKGLEWTVLDRRNLSVRFPKRDAQGVEVVKRILEIHHGYTEHEGPLGEYDSMKRKEREEKLKREEKKRKLAQKR
ncbi:MAG: hypothetical protein JRM80_08355 [Nitrososphaerota archaeon]|nr:hypothetical protein [Nitrososphaerota archaeon]MDG6990778.1 hypothetical protein [Nitrososphaerota archaeon]